MDDMAKTVRTVDFSREAVTLEATNEDRTRFSLTPLMMADYWVIRVSTDDNAIEITRITNLRSGN
jgi:hypothetical protein